MGNLVVHWIYRFIGAMAPKFDDLAKTVNDMFKEDFCTSGCRLKAKAKAQCNNGVCFENAAIEAVVDQGAPGCVKLKLPNLFRTSALSLDKLELKKNGKIGVETSITLPQPKIPGLVFEVKKEVDALGDLVNKFDLEGKKATSVGLTYGPCPDAQIKVETNLGDVSQVAAELMMSVKDGKVGVKLDPSYRPSFGVSHNQGAVFMALEAIQLKHYHWSGLYTMDAQTQFAAKYNVHENKDHSFSVGVQHKIDDAWTLKAKAESDTSIGVSLKRKVGGVSVLTGARFSPNSVATKAWGFGFECTVE